MPIDVAGYGGVVELNANFMNVPGANRLAVRVEPTTEDVFAYPDCDIGILQTTATNITQVEYFIDIETGRFTDLTFPSIFDQRPEDLSDVEILQTACGTVPAGGGPVNSAAVPALTGLTAASTIKLNFMISNSEQVEGVLTAGAPAAVNAFQPGANQITFDTNNVGQTWFASFRRTIASLPGAIGGPSAVAPYGSREVYGKVKRRGSSDTWNLWARVANLEGNRAFDSQADNIVMTYKLSQASGWNFPYFLYRLAD